MELNDLFNISDEQMATLEKNASDIQKKGEQNEKVVSYACVCCGSGWCAEGVIAND